MKKTNLDNKLKLTTETLIPLQADVLDGVAGGASIATATTIVRTALTRFLCVKTQGCPPTTANGNGSL